MGTMSRILHMQRCCLELLKLEQCFMMRWAVRQHAPNVHQNMENHIHWCVLGAELKGV